MGFTKRLPRAAHAPLKRGPRPSRGSPANTWGVWIPQCLTSQWEISIENGTVFQCPNFNTVIVHYIFFHPLHFVCGYLIMYSLSWNKDKGNSVPYTSYPEQ